MKKILKNLCKITCVTAALLFVSCESTSNVNNENFDEVITVEENAELVEEVEMVQENDETEKSEETEVVEESEAAEESSEITVIIKEPEVETYEEKEVFTIDFQEADGTKRKSLISFGNSDKFIFADDISVFTQNAIGTLKQKAGNITIYPKEGLVGFGSPYMLAYYYFFANISNGDKFCNAVDLYINDFDAKRLIRKSKKTIRKYGTMETTIYWGTIKTSTPNHGTGKCYLGYTFVENSPYFTVTIYPIINDLLEVDSTAERQSMNITYFFTKAQAKTIAKFISSESINTILTMIEQKSTAVFEEADVY